LQSSQLLANSQLRSVGCH